MACSGKDGGWASLRPRQPLLLSNQARTAHGADDWLVSYAFFDGAGAVALSKVQAEPDGATPRWVGSGRTVVNNKGNPVKQYEPYFSESWDWEDEEALESVGVTPVFFYDALGRLMRTELPNGTWRRVAFTPWRMEAWDENDTVSDTGNLWHLARQSSATPAPTAEEQRAATLTWAHRKTPTVTHFDNLGRAFLVESTQATSGRSPTSSARPSARGTRWNTASASRPTPCNGRRMCG